MPIVAEYHSCATNDKGEVADHAITLAPTHALTLALTSTLTLTLSPARALLV